MNEKKSNASETCETSVGACWELLKEKWENRRNTWRNSVQSSPEYDEGYHFAFSRSPASS